MSALPSLVSVEEYLHTDYEPDCDFVDGVLVERNVVPLADVFDRA
jgi:hypothetical protein